MRPFVFLILTCSGPFLKCHCFYSRFSEYLNTLNYYPRSGFGKRNMLFEHWFPPHKIRSSELGSGCILSTLKFKRSGKNLKIALIFFPGSGFGKRCMLSGHWFLPHVIRFSELGSGCILSMLSKCLFKYSNLFYC